MAIATSIIKCTNKIFPKVTHPFNLNNDGVKSYAEWQYEKGENTIQHFAPRYTPEDMFAGKVVLDMGCGAAGKSLYFLKMGADRVIGVDIVPKYEREAMQLAEKLGYMHSFSFVCASADDLPFPNNTFDTIIMNDFMEHISNPEAALKEAVRLVKPDGRIFINFPPYFHPFGAHMSDVINMPWVHCFFTERALVKAYKELVSGLPDASDRISLRISTDANGRDYIGYINKMTLSRFKKMIKAFGWKPHYYREIPLRRIVAPLTKLPISKEFFVKMAVCVLVKPSGEANKDER